MYPCAWELVSLGMASTPTTEPEDADSAKKTMEKHSVRPGVEHRVDLAKAAHFEQLYGMCLHTR